ncbi:probable RNA-directed DNA polymerase from transposon X-element [Trichonephila clavipes]|nr:probable RNA-directed DNA polymerase from transposon X-element [Trichonephila clavipes]
MAYSDFEKAEAFKVTLEVTFQENEEPYCDDKIEEVENLVHHYFDNCATCTPPLTSPSKVRCIIKKLQNRKAAGPDQIPNIAFKYFTLNALTHLTKLYNQCLIKNHFPTLWKQANVIMLAKPNQDRTYPQGYRPISLINATAKIFERIVLTRIKSHCKAIDCIPPEQCGFREGHSTLHQLIRVTNGVIDPPLQLTLFDDNIQWVSVVKYLGLHIDSRLTFKKHIDYLAEKFWGRISLAIFLIGRRSPLSLENKVILYKQILRPVITYGSPVWGAAATTHMKKIQEDFGKRNMPGKRATRHFSQLSEFERGLIIGMKTAGWSTHRVAGQVDRSECAVRNCWEQWAREGTHARKPGSEATRKTTRREDRRIVRQALVDPTVTR